MISRASLAIHNISDSMNWRPVNIALFKDGTSVHIKKTCFLFVCDGKAIPDWSAFF